MADITLKRSGKTATTPFTVNLIDDETGEKITYNYSVKRLGGKAAMQFQMLYAEFARDKKRDEIVGSNMIKELFDYVTPLGNSPQLIDLFDGLDEENITALITGMVDAAKANSVDEPASESVAA